MRPNLTVCGKFPDTDIRLTRLQTLPKPIEQMQTAPTAHNDITAGQVPDGQRLTTGQWMVKCMLQLILVVPMR